MAFRRGALYVTLFVLRYLTVNIYLKGPRPQYFMTYYAVFVIGPEERNGLHEPCKFGPLLSV